LCIRDRSLSPYPAAWTNFENGDQKITAKIFTAFVEKDTHNLNIGTIVSSKHEMKVAVHGGYIILKEIQLQGKKRMQVKDALNGLNLEKNAKMS